MAGMNLLGGRVNPRNLWRLRMKLRCVALVGFGMFGATLAVSSPAAASSIAFSNLNVINSRSDASRTESQGKIEIETGDDFILNSFFSITSASFIGLVPQGFNV